MTLGVMQHRKGMALGRRGTFREGCLGALNAEERFEIQEEILTRRDRFQLREHCEQRLGGFV